MCLGSCYSPSIPTSYAVIHYFPMAVRRAFLFSSDRSTYWLCQVFGWLSMVVIEMINYSFFIVKSFSVQVLYFFLVYAIEGIILMEIYRRVILRYHLFDSSISYIWLYAFISTLIVSFIMTCITQIPLIVFIRRIDWNEWTLISMVGNTINWMRYIGVWIIIYFMYNIIQQKNTIQSEKLRAENLAKTTELELLKLQLNPHFLFNALNSIKALVTINPEQSREAIVQLSELLRFTLQYGRELLIPVHHELAEVARYLELEQMRFGKKLQVEYDIADAVRQRLIPPASLLTLAENAVKHGIAKQTDPGMIRISITEEANELVKIQVINPGIYDVSNHRGIGLQHLAKRLEEVYQGRAIFHIHQQGSQVSAILCIP